MMAPSFLSLAGRAVLRIDGVDARAFLQGMISNDVRKVAPEHAIWAAFLTPQGKFLHDFFVCEQDGELLLEGEKDRLSDLRRRLSMYRLRSQVTIEELGDAVRVWALFGDGADVAVGLPAAAQAGTAASLTGGT
ncbi:MAG: folate-binding protein, partial [Rhodospirillales bacterium]|nr:folate-binding protein [Rhodospirillales bacterium]